MVGKTMFSDEEAVQRGIVESASAQRRRVLLETIRAFERADPPNRYHRLAMENLARWRREAGSPPSATRVEVLPSDWGDATLALSRRYGACFAVLNMANAFVPGGAYVEGAPAQEENLFRRTDCHFRVGPEESDPETGCYLPHMTQLLSAADGVVYLDADHPRVCIRGPEDRSRPDLGYAWLAEDQVFPFFELRSAAQDLRDGSEFDSEETRRRIAAQFDTLRAHGIRHTVLGAFGCGAFQNPAHRVAELYREEIVSRQTDFSVIAFAIFAPGYGPDNFTPFFRAFGDRR